jgi:HAD superfamily hydrolase (TIGR01509 family)
MSRHAKSGRGKHTATHIAKRIAKIRTDLPALLFDLDGTLIDSVYQHVTTWALALRNVGITIPLWKIHRRVGMSGKAFLKELFREGVSTPNRLDLNELEEKHDILFSRMIPNLQRTPGTNELLQHLARNKIRAAIATTGGKKATVALLAKIKLPAEFPVLTGDDVRKGKPSPDVFVAAAKQLHVPIENCIIVGDSVWDLLAAGRKSALGVGLLSGGSAQAELEGAGAFRVYSDPADLLIHIEQLGLPGE